VAPSTWKNFVAVAWNPFYTPPHNVSVLDVANIIDDYDLEKALTVFEMGTVVAGTFDEGKTISCVQLTDTHLWVGLCNGTIMISDWRNGTRVRSIRRVPDRHAISMTMVVPYQQTSVVRVVWNTGTNTLFAVSGHAVVQLPQIGNIVTQLHTENGMYLARNSDATISWSKAGSSIARFGCPPEREVTCMSMGMVNNVYNVSIASYDREAQRIILTCHEEVLNSDVKYRTKATVMVPSERPMTSLVFFRNMIVGNIKTPRGWLFNVHHASTLRISKTLLCVQDAGSATVLHRGLFNETLMINGPGYARIYGRRWLKNRVQVRIFLLALKRKHIFFPVELLPEVFCFL
jgi:hypothetical protein